MADSGHPPTELHERLLICRTIKLNAGALGGHRRCCHAKMQKNAQNKPQIARLILCVHTTLQVYCNLFLTFCNPPFNVDKVKSESAQSAGRLPFGLPGVNKAKEIGNANYLWVSYFYSYLNEHGRAGFVMASSATDSQGKDKDIREKLIQTGHVDVMMSVGNNFFYTKSLPCSLWFLDKGKPEHLLDTVLFIDARNYYIILWWTALRTSGATGS